MMKLLEDSEGESYNVCPVSGMRLQPVSSDLAFSRRGIVNTTAPPLARALVRISRSFDPHPSSPSPLPIPPPPYILCIGSRLGGNR